MTASEVTIDALMCRHGAAVVVNVSHLALAPGEHVALVGGNGAGKSTLLRAMTGLHPITRGRVTVDGVSPVTDRDWARTRRRIAWMPQRHATGRFPLLVRELVASGGHVAAGQAAAERLGVWELRDRPLATLSGGQLQRTFLARALASLAGDAGVLLADEPTASLDFVGQREVARIIADLSATVLVVSHDRTMAEQCHRVLEMAGGQIRELSR